MESDADDFCNSVLNQNRRWFVSISLVWRGVVRVVGHANRRVDRCDGDHGLWFHSDHVGSHPWTYESDPRLRLDNPSLMSYFVVRPGSTRLKDC